MICLRGIFVTRNISKNITILPEHKNLEFLLSEKHLEKISDMDKKEDIKKYNLRQIKLMESKILDYLNKKNPILWLINDLEALIYCIKKPPKNFIAQWSILEICYANIKYENRKNFNSLEKELIQKALKNLQNQITFYKKKYLSNLED